MSKSYHRVVVLKLILARTKSASPLPLDPHDPLTLNHKKSVSKFTNLSPTLKQTHTNRH